MASSDTFHERVEDGGDDPVADPILGLLNSVTECKSKSSPGGGGMILSDGNEERVTKESNLVTEGVAEVGQDVTKASGGVAGSEANVNKEGKSAGGYSFEGLGDGLVQRKSPSLSPSPASTPKRDGNSNEAVDVEELAARLEMVGEVASRADKRTVVLSMAVRDLEDSLEFSQHEVDALKIENAELKKRMASLETEDRRTQFQVTTVEDKMDRLETLVKKKNLLIEGIPEPVDRKEDVEKKVCELFDQLSINTVLTFEACYRMGAYNKNRTRPILVAFEKQSDRDAVYAKRMDLKNTTDYQRVWLNEDLGAQSKRKRNMIRLISKEAQQQGVDCRTGKYSLLVDKKRYDHSNLEDLPPRLHPTQLKQVQIDEKTIAYQSEYAPFSNFYPSQIKAGSHSFFCLEQVFMFLKAKTLNKTLLATKIFLSRDVHYIKSIGTELGTSDEWELRKFDVMYECVKRKFEQNPDLKSLLLKTADLQLVEATPDRLWGCGATLSSNALRRHEWPGQNKHGEILMTVREEFRRLEAE